MDFDFLGYKLRKARESKGLTQEKLGEALSVSKSTVSSWELGKNKICYEDLIKIDELLGSELAYFSKDSNNKIHKRDLDRISSVEELNDNISLLISNIKIESSHPDLIRLMVKDFLYIEVAYVSYYLQRKDIHDNKSKIYRNWGFIASDLVKVFTPDNPYLCGNPILRWVEDIDEKLTFSAFYDNEVYDEEIPDSYGLNITLIAMDKCKELRILIPDNIYENDIMMEFRYAMNSLYQLL